MAEANEAEPTDSTAPSPRRPRRKHQINLCCAQSVQVIVEEVARNLQGLGFRVTVVCGAEARAALLGSQANSNQPTIHVVCVQGSLQERVLKPLRQALATHGGPNQHLFVAVLDLAIPLAMVGQIRRFAEALERPTTSGARKPDGTFERRSWREHTGHRELDRPPQRPLPSVMQVVERPGTVPPVPEGDPNETTAVRRRTKTLTARGRALKIGPTSKYQAVTASHPVVPPSEPTARKRRRQRSRGNVAARRRGTNPRILALPDSEGSRPPPPPAPGKMARRRSSTLLPAVTPGAPPIRRPGSAGLDTATTTPHRPWVDGKPPTSDAVVEPEPDRVMARSDPSIRFTPPGVAAAQGTKTSSGRFVPVPSEPTDADKTMVHGVHDEEPRTASTLRLDEPPFKATQVDRTTLYGRDALDESGEPIEPTVIAAAPTAEDGGAQSPESDPPPAVTGETVVGPPPEPPPEVLAALERNRQKAQADQSSDAAQAGSAESEPGPDEGALVVPDEDDPSASASGTVSAVSGQKQEPARVTKPRQTVLYLERSLVHGEDSSESSKTEISESTPTVLNRPRPAASAADGGDDDPEVSESDKTLLRADGTFEDATSLLEKVRAAQAPTTPSDEDESPPRVVIGLDPEDRDDDGASKTVIYDRKQEADAGDDDGELKPEEDRDKGGTVVAAAAAIAAESARKVVGDEAKSTPTTQIGPPPEPVSKTEILPSSTKTEAPGSSTKTEVPTSSTKTEVPASSTKTEAGAKSGGTVPASRDDAEAKDAKSDAEPEARTKGRGKGRGSRGRRGAPRKGRRAPGSRRSDKPRSQTAPAAGQAVAAPVMQAQPESSGRGWVWLIVLLLLLGGGWWAYDQGMLDGVLGRSGRTDTSAIAARDTRTSAGPPAASDHGGDQGTPVESADSPTATSAATPAAADGSSGTGTAGALGSGSQGASDGAGTTGTGSQNTGDQASATGGTTDGVDGASTTSSATTSTAPPDGGADGGSTGSGPAPDSADDGGDDPTATDTPATTDTPTTTDTPPPSTDPAELTSDEQTLAKAAKEHRLSMLKTLFTTRRQGPSTTWQGGRLRCADFQVDGVGGWRLPHRREMRLINAVLPLPAGIYWTKTVPKDDRDAAYVLDTSGGGLSLFLKAEPTGDVVCVRRRESPEK